MTIAKDDILTFVNAALDAEYSGTDIDVQIQLALNDLAQMHCLETSASVSVTSSDYYLSYPSDALSTEQAVKSVVLTDASNVRLPPLKAMPGGWYEYNRQMESFTASARGDPQYKVCHNRRVYLWPAPGESFTATVWYYKNAQAIASGIEFPDDWDQAVKFGTMHFLSLLKSSKEWMELWSPQYYAEKESCRSRIQRDSMIIGA